MTIRSIASEPLPRSDPLPHVRNSESISVTVLGHQSSFAIREADEGHRLIEPKRFAVVVHDHAALIHEVFGSLVVQKQHGHGFLDNAQAPLVDALPEELLASLSPTGSIPPSQRSNRVFSCGSRILGRVVDNPLDLILQFMGVARPNSLGTSDRHIELVPNAPAVDGNISLRIIGVVNNLVTFKSREPRRVENALVLLHTHWNHLLHHDGVELLPVNHPLKLMSLIQQHCRSSRLVVRVFEPATVQDVVVRVDHNWITTGEIHELLPPRPQPRRCEPPSDIQEELQLPCILLQKPVSLLLHLFELLVREEWLNGFQILLASLFERWNRKLRKHSLEVVR
mmetsp:Transcript_89030/g.237498  ORF Transcript_89030/g.237498 Transcript_89030/m.237498 type:complete len:339 (-) Transcript_89030:599-1615(-)